MMFRAFVLAATAMILASCASPYSQEGFIGGFDAQQLREDVYRVRYSGNGYTSQETAQTYWLYRCAELALEKGYPAFEILSDMKFVMQRPALQSDDEPASGHAITGAMRVRIPPSPDELAEARGAPPGQAADRWQHSDRSAEEPVRLAASSYVFFYGGGGAAKPALEGDVHLIRRPVEPAPPKVFNASALKAALEPIVKAEKCGIGNICPHVHEYLLPKGKLQ